MVVHVDVIEAWAAAAVCRAELKALPGGRVFARVPGCAGAVATGANEQQALEDLRGVLQDWAVLGVRAGDEIPVIDGIDLNTDEVRQVLRADGS